MPGETVAIFVCYSHHDNAWVANDGLIPWLQKNLERHHVEFWWDREERDGIRGGDTWRQKIAAAIDRADIAILLMSDDFASPPFIRDFEVPRIRQRHRDGSLSIIPVLASPISKLGREELAWVYEMQIVPSEESPLIDSCENKAQWHKTRVKVQDEIYERVKWHRSRTPAPVAATKPAVATPRPAVPPIMAAVKLAPVPVKPPPASRESGRPVFTSREMTEQLALIEEEIRNQLDDQSGTSTTRAQRARLKKLSFSSKPLTDAGASILADPEAGLTGLTGLDLHGARITDAGLRELARPGGGLAALQDLWISGTKVTDDGIKALAGPDTGLPALRLLDFASTEITDAGVAELASPGTALRLLSSLYLGSTRVTDAGVKALARQDTGLIALRTLDLTHIPISDAGLMDLARGGTGLMNLLYLNLSYTKVTDAGVRALASPDSGVKFLMDLTVANQITDASLKEFARPNTSCARLKRLSLSYNGGITDAGLIELASPGCGLQALRYLHMIETRVTEAGVAALRKAKPGIDVSFGAVSGGGSVSSGPPVSSATSGPRVGRNDPCPCGSGKKYKKCHGESSITQLAAQLRR